MSFVISLLMALVSVLLGSYAIFELLSAALNIKDYLPAPGADMIAYLMSVGQVFILPIIAFIVAVLIMKRLSKGWLGIVVIVIMLAGIYSILHTYGFM